MTSQAGQRDERVGEGAGAGDPLERRGHRRGQPEHAEQRPPLGDDDVLEQVHREQVVERERVERADLDGQQERAAGEEAGDAPARRGEARARDQVGGGETRDDDEGVRVPGEAIRIHGRYASRAPPRGRSLVAKHQVSTLGTRVRFPPPASVRRLVLLSLMKTGERELARKLPRRGRSVREIERRRVSRPSVSGSDIEYGHQRGLGNGRPARRRERDRTTRFVAVPA